VSSEALALGILLLIHVGGVFVLVGLLIRSDDDHWRDWWPRDDDDDGGHGPEPGPPLPRADPSNVRLREPGRLADAHPRAPRRPEHPPQRVRERERV
jgi:hypothetical protein